ncbi:MAG: hypothetical protein SX243_24885 [Acidobacteriota bacterium]|nr:hypothetical protein [Acidobacteriota bacterium]
MSRSTNAPTFAVWVICLILFVIALLVTFGVLSVGVPLLPWTWIIGFGLLLLACQLKGL